MGYKTIYKSASVYDGSATVKLVTLTISVELMEWRGSLKTILGEDLEKEKNAVCSCLLIGPSERGWKR